MGRFDVRTTAAADRAVVALTGECDLEGREEMIAALLAAVDSAPIVHVDLAGVTFLDSSGVHSLVIAHHAAERAGVRLYVGNAEGAVARVLEITGVADLLRPPPCVPGHEDRTHD
jgi:anti-sigma B factor antagonist